MHCKSFHRVWLSLEICAHRAGVDAFQTSKRSLPEFITLLRSFPLSFYLVKHYLSSYILNLFLLSTAYITSNTDTLCQRILTKPHIIHFFKMTFTTQAPAAFNVCDIQRYFSKSKVRVKPFFSLCHFSHSPGSSFSFLFSLKKLSNPLSFSYQLAKLRKKQDDDSIMSKVEAGGRITISLVYMILKGFKSQRILFLLI